MSKVSRDEGFLPFMGPVMQPANTKTLTLPTMPIPYASVPDTAEVTENPYITSLNLSYSKPIVSVYENLNADVRIHHRMVKFFKYKMLDDWIYNDSSDILGYLKMSGSKVMLISRMSEYKKPTNNNDFEKKKSYLESEILSSGFTYKMLRQFVHTTNTNWYDLPKNEDFVRKAMEIGLKTYFKKKM